MTYYYSTEFAWDWLAKLIQSCACHQSAAENGLGLVMPVTKQAYFLMHRRRYGPEAMISSSRQIVVTNASGTVVETLGYYPYGSTRISQTTGGFSEGKQFIAQYTDLRVVSQYLLRNVSDWEITLFDSRHLLYLGYCSLTRCRPDPVLPSGNPVVATNS